MKIPLNLISRLIGGGFLILGLIGCSDDDGGPPATDVSGTWVITTWISAYVPGDNVRVTWNLTQTGSSIYGSFRDNLNQGGTVEGSISGYEVFLTFKYLYHEIWIVDYEATADAISMSGTLRGEGEVKLGISQRQLSAQ